MGAITSFLNIDYTTEEGKIKIASIIGAIALIIIIIVIALYIWTYSEAVTFPNPQNWTKTSKNKDTN